MNPNIRKSFIYKSPENGQPQVRKIHVLARVDWEEATPYIPHINDFQPADEIGDLGVITITVREGLPPQTTENGVYVAVTV